MAFGEQGNWLTFWPHLRAFVIECTCVCLPVCDANRLWLNATRYAWHFDIIDHQLETVSYRVLGETSPGFAYSVVCLSAALCVVAKQWKIGIWCVEKIFLLRGIAKSWVGFRLAQLSNPYQSTNTPKTGSFKTSPSNYGQMVADWATLWFYRRCEVIVIANAPKYSMDSH